MFDRAMNSVSGSQFHIFQPERTVGQKVNNPGTLQSLLKRVERAESFCSYPSLILKDDGNSVKFTLKATVPRFQAGKEIERSQYRELWLRPIEINSVQTS